MTDNNENISAQQSTTDIAVKVEDVFFNYPDGHEVLKGITCQIRKGEKVALIGPNGAGKSTFMSILNGVIIPQSGKVTIGGLEIQKTTLKEVRRKVGIVFQDPDDQLFCPTVFDDVAFGPLNLGVSKDEIDARVKEALRLVSLDGFEERSSFHLSFGERKRLALATVISYQPEILVFDEPSTNMDPLSRRRLIEWLQHSDKTILLCTHDLDIALEVCNRCFILTDGKIVVDGPASEILYNKTLLEKNKLELPLVIQTHELLQELLLTAEMDKDHREIVKKFLHSHVHIHGPDKRRHVHIHAHDHALPHRQEPIPEPHAHQLASHDHGGAVDLHTIIPHTHSQTEEKNVPEEDQTPHDHEHPEGEHKHPHRRHRYTRRGHGHSHDGHGHKH